VDMDGGTPSLKWNFSLHHGEWGVQRDLRELT
jgi:hypothetical protein